MIANFLAMLLVTASSLQIIGSAFAQDKIRIAWAGASPANAAVWVLQEKKLLQKYGVEPEIISISASPIVSQALLAGEIDVSAISVTTLVSSRLVFGALSFGLLDALLRLHVALLDLFVLARDLFEPFLERRDLVRALAIVLRRLMRSPPWPASVWRWPVRRLWRSLPMSALPMRRRPS